MKCPKCQGLVMGVGYAQGDEIFKCLDCKIIFTISPLSEEELSKVPICCDKCKWLIVDVCWFKNEEYSDFYDAEGQEHPDCYEVDN